MRSTRLARRAPPSDHDVRPRRRRRRLRGRRRWRDLQSSVPPSSRVSRPSRCGWSRTVRKTRPRALADRGGARPADRDRSAARRGGARVRSLTFGFTPCPNDAFAFHALVHGLVEAPFRVEPVLLDIEELNQRARTGELDLTKLSFGAAPAARDQYRLLRSGAALGHGVGPLVVAREVSEGYERIAVPGHDTTAFLLLRLAWPKLGEVVEMRYDEILDAVGIRGRRRGPDHPREPVHVRRAWARQGRRPRRVVGGGDRTTRPARRDLRARGSADRTRSSARSAPRSSTPSRIRRRAASTCASTRTSCRRTSAARTSTCTSTSSASTSASRGSPRSSGSRVG